MKLKLILLCILGLLLFNNVSAQTYNYRTTAFAYKQTNIYGNWSDWTDWQESNMLITIDYTNDIVRIFSPMTQIYYIRDYVRNYRDSSGGIQAEFKFIDQDGDRGTMRLRIETSGNSQIYVEFNNIMWVYNVIRI